VPQDPQHEDEKVDEALEETFPASDAPANTVETGIRRGPPEATPSPIVDHPERNRFELSVSGLTAHLDYRRTADTFTIVHTEVPPAMRGSHLGGQLVEAAIVAAHESGLRLIVQCPFARAYLRTNHP
jgi:predicted GNAT family acetyltransferase